MLDLLTPGLWLPPKPALIRRAEPDSAFMPVVVPPRGATPTLTYVSAYVSTPNSSDHTFTGVNIGTAGRDRTLILVTSTSAVFLECYVDGVSAPVYPATNANIRSGAICPIRWPAGTTANVRLVSSSGNARNCLGVYAAYGLWSAKPYRFKSATGTGGGADMSINTLAGGLVVAGCSAGNDPNFIWSGLTENLDSNAEGTIDWGLASASGLSKETPRAITFTNSGGNEFVAMAASFR